MTRWWLGLMLTAGCAASKHDVTSHQIKSQTSDFLRAADYYPLGEGTRWTYDVELLGEKRSMEIRLLRKTPDGAMEDSTGAQLRADQFGIRDDRRYLLKEPIEVGQTWTNVVSASSAEKYEIVAVGKTCASPLGSWQNCVVVRSTNRIKEGENLVNELTFAPGVGIVHLATEIDLGGQKIRQSTLTLVSMVGPAKKSAP